MQLKERQTRVKLEICSGSSSAIDLTHPCSTHPLSRVSITAEVSQGKTPTSTKKSKAKKKKEMCHSAGKSLQVEQKH